jgi:isopentenyl phosphate kinase
MQTIYLKLGGSLITEKHQAFTANHSRLRSLVQEIKSSYQQGEYRLILAHGSGSFGHQAAKIYGTRHGVHSQEDWMGFLEVWKQARALNQIVLDACLEAGLPVLAFPPVSAVLSKDRQILSWDTAPIQTALDHRLIPVIYGDVIFDQKLNGTILSTEELFIGLAEHIPPQSILIAGIEDGVWEDFPACTKLLKEITPQVMLSQQDNISGSQAVDVTGGMLEKVNQMLNLVQYHPEIHVQIFSGVNPGNVRKVLDGDHLGTVIRQ